MVEIAQHFRQEEIEPISEITDCDSYHKAVKNLIRRSLIADGEVQKLNPLAQFFSGNNGKIYNSYGYFQSPDHGQINIPVENLEVPDSLADFKNVLEYIFGDQKELEIFLQHNQVNPNIIHSEITIYSPNDGDDPTCAIRSYCNNLGIEISTLVDSCEQQISDWRSLTWSQHMINFANLKLDAHLQKLESHKFLQEKID